MADQPAKKLAAAFVAAAWLGCGAWSTHNTDPTTAIKSERDAYYIIGLKPRGTQVMITEGDVNDKGEFIADRCHLSCGGTGVTAGPDNGYFVGKTNPGTILGITQFQTPDDMKFTTCGKPTFVFRPEGGITYFADLDFEQEAGGKATMLHKENIEGARENLKAHFPLLADKLQQKPYEMLVYHRDGACPVGQYAPN